MRSDEITGAGISKSIASSEPIPPPPSENSRKRRIPETATLAETGDTRHLSIQQLQRAVLVEQLKVLRLKRAKLEKEAGEIAPTPQYYQVVESSVLIRSSQEICNSQPLDGLLQMYE